ncbi:MAG: hypothetical protein KA736_01585 [Crocinitomicaceae bacterium]|nr:hypothetical protein [Crocinitomicaceae bacterium]MBP6032659.1 hypothetical protein [Crocinitomicaceae bacterium]
MADINKTLEAFWYKHNHRTTDEIIADLKSDISRTKERSLEPLKEELKVERGTLSEVNRSQEGLVLTSIVLVALILFVLAVFFQKIKFKFVQFSFKNIDKRRINLILLVWGIFHFYVLITSDRIFATPNTWARRHFWIIADWESYSDSYDLSEFVIYAILPILFIFGRRYLRGEKLH